MPKHFIVRLLIPENGRGGHVPFSCRVFNHLIFAMLHNKIYTSDDVKKSADMYYKGKIDQR